MAFDNSIGIERELALGERLLWKGRPQTGIKFRSQDAFGIPFALVWCGFLIFWTISFFSKPPAGNGFNFIIVFLIPFVLVGFYMLIGRFLLDAYARRKMEYALTDRRVLIVSNAFNRKVRSIDYRNEPNIALEERRSGSGSIYFGAQPQSKNKLVSSDSIVGFDMIDNARDVYQRIMKTKENPLR